MTTWTQVYDAQSPGWSGTGGFLGAFQLGAFQINAFQMFAPVNWTPINDSQTPGWTVSSES